MLEDLVMYALLHFVVALEWVSNNCLTGLLGHHILQLTIDFHEKNVIYLQTPLPNANE